MAARFVTVDHDTPLLPPPDLRDCVPADHLVHFVIDAVSQLDMQEVRVNERGTRDEQYPPGMMLGLLIYSYSTGVFSSGQIERSTVENLTDAPGDKQQLVPGFEALAQQAGPVKQVLIDSDRLLAPQMISSRAFRA